MNKRHDLDIDSLSKLRPNKPPWSAALAIVQLVSCIGYCSIQNKICMGISDIQNPYSKCCPHKKEPPSEINAQE